jgi:hypothetical protein
VRGALADHPDEQTISLLAISVSNLRGATWHHASSLTRTR